MVAMYESLARQADWWMTYRTRNAECGTRNDGARKTRPQVCEFRIPHSAFELPYYLHGNDSGWDNSTMFQQGVPLIAPDLVALLVLQMDVLAELAGELGRAEAAAGWQERADALFESLMDELWCGDHFIARLANDGTPVESQSLIPWLPIILGERLPKEVRECLKQGIEGHLTEWGLATEKVGSPKYQSDGYWQGPIWGPSTFIAVTGLARSGFDDFADTVSERFCRLCGKSGFAENYDAVSGDPLCDPAYTWTASAFLLLAERLNR